MTLIYRSNVIVFLIFSTILLSHCYAKSFGDVVELQKSYVSDYGFKESCHLWVAYEFSLYAYDKYTFPTESSAVEIPVPNLDTATILDMFIRDTIVYLATTDGVYWCDAYTGKQINSEIEWQFYFRKGIKGCTADSSGEIWMITNDSILTYHTDKTISSYDQSELENCQYINIDKCNNIWISYFSEDDNAFKVCQIKSGTNNLIYYPDITLNRQGKFYSSYVSDTHGEETLFSFNNEHQLIWYNNTSDSWSKDTSCSFPSDVSLNDICIFDELRGRDKLNVWVISIATDKGIYWNRIDNVLELYEDNNSIGYVGLASGTYTEITIYAANNENKISIEALSPCLDILFPNKIQKINNNYKDVKYFNLQGRMIGNTFDNYKNISSGVILMKNVNRSDIDNRKLIKIK